MSFNFPFFVLLRLRFEFKITCIQFSRKDQSILKIMPSTSVPQLHGKTYFRLEHYLPVSVLDKLNQTTIKEELPKLHSNYYGASDTEAEFEFLKVSETRV